MTIKKAKQLLGSVEIETVKTVENISHKLIERVKKLQEKRDKWTEEKVTYGGVNRFAEVKSQKSKACPRVGGGQTKMVNCGKSTGG